MFNERKRNREREKESLTRREAIGFFSGLVQDFAYPSFLRVAVFCHCRKGLPLVVSWDPFPSLCLQDGQLR